MSAEETPKGARPPSVPPPTADYVPSTPKPAMTREEVERLLEDGNVERVIRKKVAEELAFWKGLGIFLVALVTVVAGYFGLELKSATDSVQKKTDELSTLVDREKLKIEVHTNRAREQIQAQIAVAREKAEEARKMADGAKHDGASARDGALAVASDLRAAQEGLRQTQAAHEKLQDFTTKLSEAALKTASMASDVASTTARVSTSASQVEEKVAGLKKLEEINQSLQGVYDFIKINRLTETVFLKTNWSRVVRLPDTTPEKPPYPWYDVSLCMGDIGRNPALSWGVRRVAKETPPLQQAVCNIGVVKLDISKLTSQRATPQYMATNPEQWRLELPLPQHAPYAIYVDFLYHSVFGDDFVVLRVAPSGEVPSAQRFSLETVSAPVTK